LPFTGGIAAVTGQPDLTDEKFDLARRLRVWPFFCTQALFIKIRPRSPWRAAPQPHGLLFPARAAPSSGLQAQ
jgi:hypothetical protein